MDIEALRRCDLNLLVLLHVLLDECSVSRAAERLNLSQSAISRSLQRLRDNFDDELFIRRPHGLQPTARALELRTELAEVLQQLSLLIRPPAFDPAACQRQFTLSVMDHIAVQLIPGLLEYLAEVAPGVRIQLAPWSRDSLRELASGKLDMAINFVSQDRPDLYQRVLCSANPVALFYREHPFAKLKQLTMQQFLAVPHIKVHIAEFSELGRLDRELERQGLHRTIALETTDIRLALELTRHNQGLMFGTREMSRVLVERFDLDIVELPETVRFSPLNYLITWHRLQHRDPAQCWLRNVIYERCLTLC